MIGNWTSRYRPRYLRSLVYMLQSTEYNAGDFLDWFERTADFAHVERRKQLVKTPKARLLLALAWAVALLLGAGIATAAWLNIPIWLKAAVIILALLLAPRLVAYSLLLPLLVVRWLIQRPVELVMTRCARQRLARHSAVKIAVAGSFGKTTMREILRSVLSGDKRVAAPPHSVNTPLGISRFIEGLSGDEEVLIFELGEYYPGDVRRLCRLVQPDIGIITGVNEAHLRKFKKLERTTATIFELADWLGDRPVYVNGENELAARAARPGHIIYSRQGAGCWRVESPATGLGGTSFTLAGSDSKIAAETPLLGLHQIVPLAAAADIASGLGLSAAQIRAGIAATRPFEHRMQPVTDAAGVTTLDDSYNGNPDGVKAVIDWLAGLTGHRRIYVTPGLVEMGSRSRSVHEQIGRQLAAAGIEQVILIRNSVTPGIEAGLQAGGFRGQLTWFDDGLAAFAALPHLTAPGDVVLLQNDWPDQYA